MTEWKKVNAKRNWESKYKRFWYGLCVWMKFKRNMWIASNRECIHKYDEKKNKKKKKIYIDEYKCISQIVPYWITRHLGDVLFVIVYELYLRLLWNINHFIFVNFNQTHIYTMCVVWNVEHTFINSYKVTTKKIK